MAMTKITSNVVSVGGTAVELVVVSDRANEIRIANTHATDNLHLGIGEEATTSRFFLAPGQVLERTGREALAWRGTTINAISSSGNIAVPVWVGANIPG